MLPSKHEKKEKEYTNSGRKNNRCTTEHQRKGQGFNCKHPTDTKHFLTFLLFECRIETLKNPFLVFPMSIKYAGPVAQ